MEFPKVYYFGKGKKKIRSHTGKNNGYDDDRGDYRLVLHDHIAYRYEVLSVVGKGSFGKVAKCFDHKRQEFVALKIIRNMKRFHQQALVEVKVLEHIREKDEDGGSNIIHVKSQFYFRSHLCITFELLHLNLYE